MNDDVVADLCPDIMFISSESMCLTGAMQAMIFCFHNNMQKYSTVWHSYSFTGSLKK